MWFPCRDVYLFLFPSKLNAWNVFCTHVSRLLFYCFFNWFPSFRYQVFIPKIRKQNHFIKSKYEKLISSILLYQIHPIYAYCIFFANITMIFLYKYRLKTIMFLCLQRLMEMTLSHFYIQLSVNVRTWSRMVSGATSICCWCYSAEFSSVL